MIVHKSNCPYDGRTWGCTCGADEIEFNIQKGIWSDLRDRFNAWISNEPEWDQDRYGSEAWRICSYGCPKQGEYAHDGLEQLWQAYRAGWCDRGVADFGRGGAVE